MKDDEDKNRNDALVTRDDDSDGISVITDCEKSDDNLYRSLTEIIKPVDKIQLPVHFHIYYYKHFVRDLLL